MNYECGYYLKVRRTMNGWLWAEDRQDGGGHHLLLGPTIFLHHLLQWYVKGFGCPEQGPCAMWTIYYGSGKGNIDFYTVHWGALKPSCGGGCCHTQGEQLCLFVQYLRLLAIKQGQSQMASCIDYQRCSLPCNTPYPGEHFFSSVAPTTSPPLSSHSFPVTPSPDFI